MSVAVLTNVYREENWIDGCVRQFRPFCLRHVVLNSLVSWQGAYDRQDRTTEIAKALGAEVLVGSWDTEAEQFNYGLDRLKNYDWVIICDADERYKESNIEALLDHLNNINPSCSGLKTNRWDVYWKTPEFVLTPEQTDYPLIAVRPQAVNFVKARDPGPIEIQFVSSKMYHFSYVRTNEEMERKIANFSHADEFNLEDWYIQKWLLWTPEMRNLHPVVPEQFERAVYSHCPDEIRKLISDEYFRDYSSHART